MRGRSHHGFKDGPRCNKKPGQLFSIGTVAILSTRSQRCTHTVTT
jgi:hypothetical protein